MSASNVLAFFSNYLKTNHVPCFQQLVVGSPQQLVVERLLAEQAVGDPTKSEMAFQSELAL